MTATGELRGTAAFAQPSGSSFAPQLRSVAHTQSSELFRAPSFAFFLKNSSSPLQAAQCSPAHSPNRKQRVEGDSAGISDNPDADGKENHVIAEINHCC